MVPVVPLVMKGAEEALDGGLSLLVGEHFHNFLLRYQVAIRGV